MRVKSVDRTECPSDFNWALAGVALSFRPEVVEESELRLPELRSWFVPMLIRLFRIISRMRRWLDLRWSCGDISGVGESDEAQKVADEYFEKVKAA